ncbi:MAG: hypothetical protein KIH64_013065 [Mycobacterium sp.]|nr:hypothetical protein [Mycobacterium sp.]
MLSTAGEILVNLNNPITDPITNPLTMPILRTRVGRIAWSYLAHPVKSREFPAKHERLVTADELMMYGFSGF